MDRQIKQVEFSKLRHAYQTIKTFLVEESFEEVKNRKMRVAEDLGMYGDDNYDLLVKFVDKFELDHKDFDYSKHFHSEGEIFGSGAALINLLALSVWLPLKTIKLLTFNSFKLPRLSLHQPNNEVSDMTFKDLLTWYIEGKYATEKDIKYEIKTSHNIV